MAEKKDDLVGRIKELEAERSKLLDEAKKAALDTANAAIRELNALGFNYQLVEGGKVSRQASTRRAAGGIKDAPCPVCGFKTRPLHDARRHRFSKAKKRPFTQKELTALGLRKVS